jgi:hypothetical protein
MNIITHVRYGGGSDPLTWHRAEWVTTGAGVRAIRYETDYDLTTLLRNLSVAGGLALAWKMGDHYGAHRLSGDAIVQTLGPWAYP